MNFNLNMQVDKVMNKLSESKPLRIWSYIIASLIVIAVLAWQAPPIILAVVELIKVIR